MHAKSVFMGYTKDDVSKFVLLMVLAFVVVPLVVETEYWYSSILIPWLCLALAAVGQQIVMGFAGQLALGAAGFMAAGAFACYNFILRVPDLPFFAGSGHIPDGCHACIAVFYCLDDRQVRLV